MTQKNFRAFIDVVAWSATAGLVHSNPQVAVYACLFNCGCALITLLLPDSK